MDNNAEKAYEDGFVAGVQHNAESRVSKFIDASMRKWVGLTDEEVSEYLADEWVGYSGYFSCFEEVMKWAEEKLKDKNGG